MLLAIFFIYPFAYVSAQAGNESVSNKVNRLQEGIDFAKNISGGEQINFLSSSYAKLRLFYLSARSQIKKFIIYAKDLTGDFFTGNGEIKSNEILNDNGFEIKKFIEDKYNYIKAKI